MDFHRMNLWRANTPSLFWLPQEHVPEELWCDAYTQAAKELGITTTTNIEDILAWTLGESRFGPRHWTLSPAKRIYYLVKPALPRSFTRLLRQLYNRPDESSPGSKWPIEASYVGFLRCVLVHILRNHPTHELTIRSLWPDGCPYAFVLTHDVESSAGRDFVRRVADLEEDLGFRSSFNFVAEHYQLDLNLIRELRERGFEVGLHGLKHDGRLFTSRAEFDRRARKINRYLKELDITGFRAPLTHRNPEWMQALDIEYDLSFFDTDPFEPIPGGCMSIWPFFIGNFIELPYTLVQDYTLTSILKETTPRIWLEKVDFIEKYNGMALINTHPDYLRRSVDWGVYSGFLREMRERGLYWHALPAGVARWWRKRSSPVFPDNAANNMFSTVTLNGETLRIEPTRTAGICS